MWLKNFEDPEVWKQERPEMWVQKKKVSDSQWEGKDDIHGRTSTKKRIAVAVAVSEMRKPCSRLVANSGNSNRS